VDEGGMIRSDLRFAILKALRAEGIAIPYPQREVRHIGGAGSSAIVS
jgi:small-conductance mechanosensitive channel